MKRIYRSRKNKMIAGICGGFAEMFSQDPTLIRIVVVLLALVTAILPFLLTYIIGWIIIPYEDE